MIVCIAIKTVYCVLSGFDYGARERKPAEESEVRSNICSWFKTCFMQITILE